jgi:hypothetical protein
MAEIASNEAFFVHERQRLANVARAASDRLSLSANEDDMRADTPGDQKNAGDGGKRARGSVRAWAMFVHWHQPTFQATHMPLMTGHVDVAADDEEEDDADDSSSSASEHAITPARISARGQRAKKVACEADTPPQPPAKQNKRSRRGKSKSASELLENALYSAQKHTERTALSSVTSVDAELHLSVSVLQLQHTQMRTDIEDLTKRLRESEERARNAEQQAADAKKAAEAAARSSLAPNAELEKARAEVAALQSKLADERVRNAGEVAELKFMRTIGLDAVVKKAVENILAGRFAGPQQQQQ